MLKQNAFTALLLCLSSAVAFAQEKQVTEDSLVVSNSHIKVVANLLSGKVNYYFTAGAQWVNTISYVQDVRHGMFSSDAFTRHSFTTDEINDPLGKAICINFIHEDANKGLRLIQYITVYASQPFILISTEAAAKEKGTILETRNISPVTVLPEQQSRIIVPGTEALITDYPFDNDNWVDVISRQWPANERSVSGISYELASAYDRKTKNGFTIGSLVHDFWKTGIRYGTGTTPNHIDSLIIYGGVATKDDPSLPDSYGGKDGTHDYIAHGTQVGEFCVFTIDLLVCFCRYKK